MIDEINEIPSRYHLDIAKIVYRNIDEEEAHFSYFSTNPETVIFGKEEKQVFTPLKKKTVISRIVQMQGVFNISPASISDVFPGKEE